MKHFSFQEFERSDTAARLKKVEEAVEEIKDEEK